MKHARLNFGLWRGHRVNGYNVPSDWEKVWSFLLGVRERTRQCLQVRGEFVIVTMLNKARCSQYKSCLVY